MKRRPLGATGITVGEIGLGAWQLANPDWGVYDRAEALRVVQQALDAGCDFFDTAPPYGGGRNEKLLGRALAGVRPSVTICTKFGAESGAGLLVEDVEGDLDRAAARGPKDRLQVAAIAE